MRRKFRRQPPQIISPNETFFKPKVQTKLKMGKAGDKYEVEADHMADKVVNNTSSDSSVQKKEGEEEVQQKPLASQVSSFVQRMEASEEEPVQKKSEKEEEPIQKMEEEESVQAMEEEEGVQKVEEEESVQAKCTDCAKEEKKVQKSEEEEVQAKSNNSNSINSKTENSLKNSQGGGRKMDSHTRTEMEQGFGADFSHINIHTDNNAVQMNKDMNAQAFTYGNDIFFNSGKYDPDSSKGKHLLAHELTHTIQQKGMVQKKVQMRKDEDCSLADSFPNSTGDFTNLYITGTYTPGSSNALNIEVTMGYEENPGNIGPEDFSVQVMKCGTFFDTKIGSKRLGPNIPDTLTTSIASVTAGDKYYLRIYTRSNLRVSANYNVWQ